ncbi:MAG: PD-(D/E)XK nuclease family protein, partial [Actinomycetota bacterium]
CAPMEDGRLLEGYVDLLYQTEEGLVVVDYKTSSTAAEDEIEARLHGYRLQGQAYAVGARRATGEAITEVTFLFLTPTGPVERNIADLPETIDQTRSSASSPTWETS